MHFSKLITVLKGFNAQQLKQLKKFVRSPYFEVYPPSVTLLNYLLPLHPRFNPQKITIEKLKQVDTVFSTRAKQETAGVRLLRAIEKFVATEQWQQNKSEVKRYQLAGYNALHLTDEFNRQLAKEMERLNQNAEQNFDTFYEKHMLTEISLSGFSAKLNRTANNSIMPVIETLDVFHAIKKLRYLCEALNRKQFLGTSYHDEQMPVLLKILEPYTKPNYPYVYLFVNVYRLLSADGFEDAQLYHKLIKAEVTKANRAPSPTQQEAMGYAANCLITWHNKGYSQAGKEYLWWIDWKQANNLLLENGKLQPVTFRNMVTFAFGQKAAGNIQQVIKTYAHYLPTEHYDTNLAFANGLYWYRLKQHKKAIRFFLMAQAKEVVVFNCIIRLWHYKCLYEYDRNDTDALFTHLSNFEKYLLRYKSELHQLPVTFQQFITYNLKLLKAENHEVLNKLQSEIEEKNHFAGRPWLLQQLAAKNKKPVQMLHGSPV